MQYTVTGDGVGCRSGRRIDSARSGVLSTATRLFRSSSGLRLRLIRLYAFLLVFNVGSWGLVLAASVSYPILLPTALLAYTFG